MAAQLKLRANDAEDLSVIAACLQDALLPQGDMIFLKPEKRFVLVANRFCWEGVEGEPVEGRMYERVYCGITFDSVRNARIQGLEQGRKSHVLELLTLETGDGHIDLIFAGGGMVRLEIDHIRCHLEDIDEPWPTQWRPTHEGAEEG